MNDLYVTYNWGNVDPAGNKPLTNFVPVRIIFNDETTVCYFEDGSKVVVTCSEDDEYTKEAGVAACIAKRVFGSRSAFLKNVEKGYRQPSKSKDEKKLNFKIDYSVNEHDICTQYFTETFKQVFKQFRYY